MPSITDFRFQKRVGKSGSCTSKQQMGRSAILINAARGGIVNEDDLEKALSEKLLWGAGLDCHEEESPPWKSTRRADCLNLQTFLLRLSNAAHGMRSTSSWTVILLRVFGCLRHLHCGAKPLSWNSSDWIPVARSVRQKNIYRSLFKLPRLSNLLIWLDKSYAFVSLTA